MEITEQYQDRSEEWARAKRIFNILADYVEPWPLDWPKNMMVSCLDMSF